MERETLKLALEALEEADEIEFWNKQKQAITAIKEALAQPDYRAVKTYHEGKPVYVSQPARQKSGIANSPSDPEICNERSAQACGPVYCGDSGGYCNKCPKQKIIQAVKPCKGMNCGCTDGRSHSLECLAELAAAIAGGMFFPSVYTTPPKRPWVGLTKDERLELYRQFKDCLESDDWEYEKAIEAALRSKNFG